MEFSVKLQKLRRAKNLTQEELASALYVSRTAISKWESGRGFPNLESLRLLSAFFEVTVDELLSGSELLELAEDDGKRRVVNLRDLLFGLLDISALLLLFLPFFAQSGGLGLEQVSLLAFSGGAPYLKVIFLCCAGVLASYGVLTLAMQNCTARFWVKIKAPLSLFLALSTALLFVVSRQVYAALFALFLLILKAVFLYKCH